MKVMNKTIKLIAAAIIMSSAFYFSSCIGSKDDFPDRTAETEQKELAMALANLEKAGYDVDTTTSGAYYVMNKQGTGLLPQKGDTCLLIYTGYFLDGGIFDSSGRHYKDSIWQIKFKEVNVIKGFEDGIGLLNKGAKIDIIVPSNLAYGARGFDIIPPYTPIVYTMEMRDLKPVAQN
jgi:FKBP-type peptidyl-prolyl cis-trans isomerase